MAGYVAGMESGGQLARPRLPERRPSRAFDALALYSFVVLGLPDGALGTAWPVLRKGFGAPLDALGVVLLVGTAGSVASSSVSGLAFARLGRRWTIMLAGAAGAAGALAGVVAPSFGVFVLAGALLGLSAGLLDSAVNTSVALSGRNRLLNMVHGAYGVGTTVAPLVVTAAVLLGSWRASYGAVFLAEAALVTAWGLSGPQAGPKLASTARARDKGAPRSRRDRLLAAREGAGAPPPGPPRDAHALKTERARPARALIGLSLVVFLVYTGLEVSAGYWSPSFDRAVLHMGAGATGVVTFGYWGALTVARFALAVPKRPVAATLVVRWGCLGALGGAVLLWWRPVAVLAPVGLVVIGAALAGVFPALVALTPARVGEGLAHHVIGWQIGAAGLGGSAVSALFGLVFQHMGLVELGPALFAVASLLVAASFTLERVAP